MNTLIYGAQATGKTELAKLLQKRYVSKGGVCEIIEEVFTDSLSKAAKMHEQALLQIRKSRGSKHLHLIYVTPMSPSYPPPLTIEERKERAFALQNFDFIIRCERISKL